MNIKELKNDGLSIQVSMDFGKEDYADKKKKALNKFRKDADIKGFRKGMAPMSLVEKMHGQSALVNSINDLISESLTKFIEDNKLSIIGEPLPLEEAESKNDWDNGEDFNFVFDIALAPKVDFTLSKSDKITQYEVTFPTKAKQEYQETLLKQYAKLENCDQVKDEDFIVADFVQDDTKVEATYISMKTIEGKAAKAIFLGQKPGASFNIDVVEAFPNETDRAAMLKMKKEELPLNPIWNLTIKEVKNYVDATLGEDLYNQMFGEGTVKTEAEFDAKIEERMATEFKQEADYRFMLDAREYIMKKADIKIDEDFMKRWLFHANDGKFTMEEIQKEFHLFIKDFRWQTISQYIMKEQKLQVTKEAVMEQARQLASYQFAMYGIANIPEEHLAKYAENMLQQEKEGRKIYEKVEQDMVVNYIRSVVTIDSKKIASDKLRKMNE